MSDKNNPSTTQKNAKTSPPQVQPTEATPEIVPVALPQIVNQALANPRHLTANNLIQLQRQLGNRVTRNFLAAPAADLQRNFEGMTWRETGNLIGSPPVRDETGDNGLPNKGIVENNSSFAQLVAAARDSLVGQRARADGLIDESGNVTDHRYWFARVYQYVTENEIAEAQATTFFYPTYVMRCVLYFEKIYTDNFEAFTDGRPVEDHWREAFEVAASNDEVDVEDLTTLAGYLTGVAGGPVVAAAGTVVGDAIADMLQATQSMIASMKAHIRYDLPRAEAWVYNTHYAAMQEAGISNFMPDFMSMSGVFDRAAERMNAEIMERTWVPTTMVPRMLQDWSMRYLYAADMGQERADTWQRAEELVNLNLMSENPYENAEDGSLVGDVTTSDNQSPLQNLSSNLRPDMADPAGQQSDSEIRDDVAANPDALDQKPATERIRMIQRLAQGATLNDDEATIMTILQASVTQGDVVEVIDGAGPWELMYAVDGSDYNTLRSFYRNRYYPGTSQSTLITLINRCLSGETAEWEEQMVADIVVDRSDGYSIIEGLGDSFDDGLDRIEWQLDGSDESRVEELYGSSSGF